MTDVRRSTNKYEFFDRFLSFDCTNENDGFDVEAGRWFRPAEMKIILQRLWFFGGEAHGMDIAEDLGIGNGAKGSRWGIGAATSPRFDRSLDAWLKLLAGENLDGCLVSISYSIPDAALTLFLCPSEPSEQAQAPRV